MVLLTTQSQMQEKAAPLSPDLPRCCRTTREDQHHAKSYRLTTQARAALGARLRGGCSWCGRLSEAK